MDVISILKILRTRLWVLIVFPLVAVLCTAFFISRMDRVYKSTGQVSTGFTSDDAVILSEEKTSNPFEVTTRFSNTIEAMKSIQVMSLVSYRLALHDLDSARPFRRHSEQEDASLEADVEMQGIIRETFARRLAEFQPLNSYDPEDELAFSLLEAYKYDYESLQDKFSIIRRGTSDFITVEFLSENPLLSAYAVNALCQEFLRYNKTLKTDRSSESIDFLEKTMVEKKALLDQKTTALSEYKVANNVVNYNAETESKIMQLSTYELNREIEQKKVSGLSLSLNTVKAKIQTFRTPDKDEIAKVNQRIIELRRKINDLGAGDTGANKARIAQLREDLQLEISRLETASGTGESEQDLEVLVRERERLELEIQITTSNLLAIEQSLRKLRVEVSGFASTEARLADLQRDLQVATDEYKSAQEKHNAAVSKASVIGSSLRQILQAQPSSEPEPSKGMLLTGLAGVGSFILCAMGLIAVEFANFSIRSQGRLETITSIKNIGILNQVDLNGMNLKALFEGKVKDKDADVFIHFLRKLRFEVQNAKGQVLLVTSTKATVGKSFIIICLAYTMSLLGKRILIIDTNFKTSTLTKLLIGKTDNHKLLNRAFATNLYLAPHKKDATPSDDEEEVPRSIVHMTEFTGVDIIGNYGGTDSPSEILAGKDFKEMVRKFGLEYDYIILEGPSLNDYSDTKELVEFVDKVIPIFDAESTMNSLDHDSIKYLRSIKGKLLGSVLNRVRQKDLMI